MAEKGYKPLSDHQLPSCMVHLHIRLHMIRSPRQLRGADRNGKGAARIYDNLRKAFEKGILVTIGSDSFNSDMTPYGETAIKEIHDFVYKGGDLRGGHHKSRHSERREGSWRR